MHCKKESINCLTPNSFILSVERCRHQFGFGTLCKLLIVKLMSKLKVEF